MKPRVLELSPYQELTVSSPPCNHDYIPRLFLKSRSVYTHPRFCVYHSTVHQSLQYTGLMNRK